MEIGYRYNSPAILPEPDDNSALYENPRHSRARPGGRAPHLILHRTGKQISILDLFGKNFVMLAGPDGSAWCDGARDAALRLGLNLDAYRIDDLADPDHHFAETYGISPSGGVLVRPDGFIGWRSRAAEVAPEKELTRVLLSLLQAPNSN